jgi:hypothetical protein
MKPHFEYCYKITTKDNRSLLEHSKSINYEIGKWNLPTVENSKLFVFKTQDAAEVHLKLIIGLAQGQEKILCGLGVNLVTNRIPWFHDFEFNSRDANISHAWKAEIPQYRLGLTSDFVDAFFPLYSLNEVTSPIPQSLLDSAAAVAINEYHLEFGYED